MRVENSSMINFRGSNKEEVASQNKFLRVGGHNKVTFGANYGFIGKMGNWKLERVFKL